MNLSKTIEKSARCELVMGEAGLERTEGAMQSLTPIKRSTLPASNFYSTLSPLPLPPKMEHPNQESFGSYSKELMYVETPVAKEGSKLPIQEEEEMQCDGIVNRIIFESSDEDRHNHSSSDCEDDDSEEDSENSDNPIVEDDLPQDEESKMMEGEDEEEEEEEEEFSGEKDPSKDHHKVKRASKARANLAMSRQPPVSNPSKKVYCNCKKTKCLKLYCDCFRLNQVCDGCNCVGCHNLQVYNDERSNAILVLMDRNPDPFGQKIEADKHLKGCNCKKSNCLKKYCECFQAGLKCGDNCKCEECKNMSCEKDEGHQHFQDEANQLKGLNLTQNQSKSSSTAKKQRRMLQM